MISLTLLCNPGWPAVPGNLPGFPIKYWDYNFNIPIPGMALPFLCLPVKENVVNAINLEICLQRKLKHDQDREHLFRSRHGRQATFPATSPHFILDSNAISFHSLSHM